MQIEIRCYECDSEYKIEYEQGCISDEIKYCAICSSNEIEIEEIEDVDL